MVRLLLLLLGMGWVAIVGRLRGSLRGKWNGTREDVGEHSLERRDLGAKKVDSRAQIDDVAKDGCSCGLLVGDNVWLWFWRKAAKE